jgi:hypothetical protein
LQRLYFLLCPPTCERSRVKTVIVPIGRSDSDVRWSCGHRHLELNFQATKMNDKVSNRTPSRKPKLC